MSRFTPTTVLSEYAAIAAINSNFEDISVILDELLSRYADGDNAMQSDLDMNNFQIKNLGDATNNADAVTYGQVTTLISALSGSTGASSGTFISVKDFGAVGDGVAVDFDAVQAAVNFSKLVGANYGNHYGGGPRVYSPAGTYYMAGNTLEIFHTVIFEGDGSGRVGPGGHGATCYKWDDNTDGIRVAFPLTSGNTTTGVTPHDAGGGVLLKGMCLRGGFAGTESAHHAVVARGITFCEDIYAVDWPGNGFEFIAGLVNSTSVSYSGNCSTSRFIGCRAENCTIGYNIRGTDSNVITVMNCEAYTNRQAGFVDENGAGSNVYISTHAAGNGTAIAGQAPTMCYYSGYRYAVKWNEEVWCSTHAPTGAATDNQGWLVMSSSAGPAGEAPQWVNGMSCRWGGDYVVLPYAGVTLYTPYSEGGVMSQFIGNTTIYEGTIADIYYRGGRRMRFDYDGYAIRNNGFGASMSLHLDCAAGAYSGLDFRQDAPAGGVPAILANITATSGYFQVAGSSGGLIFSTIAGGVTTNRAIIDPNGLNVLSSGAYFQNGVKVVGARGAAVADATDAASAITQLNALLARCRAHGLIDT